MRKMTMDSVCKEDNYTQVDLLRLFCQSHDRIFIYGAGQFASQYYKIIRNMEFCVDGFIETRKTREECFGIKVLDVESADRTVSDNSGVILAFNGSNPDTIKRLFKISNPDILSLDHFLLFYENVRGGIEKYFEQNLSLVEDEDDCVWNNILVIRLDAIGDTICITPFLRELKKMHPNSNVTVVVRRQVLPLLSECPYIDMLLGFDIPYGKWRIEDQFDEINIVSREIKKYTSENFRNRIFDVVFLAKGLMGGRNVFFDILLAEASGAKRRYGRIIKDGSDAIKYHDILSKYFSHIYIQEMGRHESDYILDLLGDEVEDNSIELWFNGSDIESTNQKLRAIGLNENDTVIAFVPMGTMPQKNWGIKKYCKLARLFKEKYDDQYRLLILGDVSTGEITNKISWPDNVIDLSGKLELRETEVVISMCSLYIGSNTGILHMAAAYRIPSICFYMILSDSDKNDPNGPVRWGVREAEHVALIPPAGLDGCYKVCRKNYPHCINQITEEDVFGHAMDILSKISLKQERTT